MKNPILNAPELWRSSFPIPTPGSHKYTRGHTLVLSGGAFTTGAARLAARGALRMGSGLVTLGTPREAAPIHGAHVTSIMLRPVDSVEELSILLESQVFKVVVIGPGRNGLSPHSLEAQELTRGLVQVYALKGQGALVLDADGLTSFAPCREELRAAVATMAPRPVILTPHEGEFARLFPHLKEGMGDSASKGQKAMAAAQEMGAWVVLKGACTCIAGPQEPLILNDRSVPWLASAGTGDVLAGFIAGLLAQGMKPHEACAAAVWLHSEAGQQLGPGLISEDLPEAIPSLLKGFMAQKH